MRNTDNYQAWKIQEKDFPSRGSIEDQINFLIGYGILAPSTHNTQPWVFAAEANELDVRPDCSYHLPEADPDHRNIFVSVGACVFNIRVAAAHFGLATKFKLGGSGRDDGHIILTFSKGGADKALAKLFPQITRRYSEKRIMPSLEIKAATAKALSRESSEVSVRLIGDAKAIKELSELCLQSASSYAAKPLFAKEISAWMRTNKTKLYDGMPGFSSGLSTPKVAVGTAVLRRSPKILKPMAKKYFHMVATSPLLGIVTTPGDKWEDWVKAGAEYERLSLEASAQNISSCPMAALIERPEARRELNKYFGSKQGIPQMFFRLIKVSDANIHTPRRPQSRRNAEMAVVEKLRKEGTKVTLRATAVGRYKVSYIEAGKGDPLLLIHGANIGWGQWAPNIHELSKKYRVIALDLPGCGGSTQTDFNSLRLGDFVAVTADFIKQLRLRSLTVVGHSFGGAIAIKLAGRSDIKVSKLILVNPLGFTRNVPGKQKLITLRPFAKLLSKTAIKPTRANMEKFLAEPLVRHDGVTKELVDYYWTAIKENRFNHPILFMHSLTRPLIIRKELLLANDFAYLKQPALVIIGNKDPLTPLAKVKRGVERHKNARLEVFDNTGHVPSLERSKKFNETILNFLK